MTKAKLVAMGLTVALTLIPFYEGTRLKAYKDPVGIWTDCIGHTGPDVRSVNTMEQCNAKFYADLATADATVQRCVAVALSSNERSAYSSFAFNVGPGKVGVKDGFCTLKSGRTPTFLKALNAGNREAACTGLLQWDKAGGVPLPGLTKRRKAESVLCLTK
jgi:lysozyme